MKVGDRLPELTRTIALSDMVAYGAATWDWHRLHYDSDHARRAGLPTPVVDGQMLGALLAEQIVRALDEGDRIVRLYFQNRAPVFPGDTIRCEAWVEQVSDERIQVEQRVTVGDRLVVAPAGAEILLAEAH